MSSVPSTPTSYNRETRSCETSFSQQRLWFLNQLLPGVAAYNVPIAFRLCGNLNAEILEKCFIEIIRRHEILRTTFMNDQGQPRQVISESCSFSLPLVEMEPGADLSQILTEEIRQPFCLERGPLIRATLFQTAPAIHFLLITMHHIITDGWSHGILVAELSALYKAYSQGLASPLADLTFQYSDFARWQREQLNGKVLEEQLSFWKNHIGNGHSVLQLPSDRPRPEIATYSGKCVCFKLSTALSESLVLLARKTQSTLFMVLLASFNILLHRYTGSKEIVVGSPIANRTRVEVEPLIGFFVNTLALRAEVDPGQSFSEFLAQIRNTALAAYTHGDLPFEKLVEEIQPERTLAYNPIFQVAFGLHRAHLINPDFPGIEAEEIFVDRESVPFDLNVSVIPHPQGFLVEIEYSTDLFDADRITRMFGHYKTLLEGIVENPQQQISQLPLLTETEWQEIVLDRNDTAVDYPKSQTIHELFEKQALETPNATAITFEDRHITYRDLNILSDRLARILSNEGVVPEEIVGIHLERSIEMIVGLLAILKAGAAYLPLDPSMPRERLTFLASDAGIKKVLVHPSNQRNAEMPPARMIPIDLESLQQVSQESALLKSTATAGQMCYVLYTSGSTGRPKGVCVPHRAVVHLVKGCNYVDLGPAEVLLQYAPLSFDASTFEIWGALLNGARLVIAPPGVRTLTELGEIIRDHCITTLWLTSVLFNEMVDQRIDDLAGVRQLLAGGDVFSVSHARKAMSHLKNCRVTNCYGPTECTTFTLYHHIREIEDSATSIPIGRPISNTRVYILDASLQPMPIGVPGEIYIGGDGLAIGYLNQPELTAEKFVHDPYSSQDRSFLYRTGDVGYWNDQGSVEFVGRTDDQIKIRGFRIEPAEIESALSRHPSIAQSLVLPYQSPDAGKQLIAYIVATEQLSQNDVRNFLEKQLPSYMLPVFSFFLSELPLNANGKVDRSALPLPDSSPIGNSQGSRSGPENYLESQMIRIWQRVLKRKSIGVHDNFFDLGGHSLLALKLFAEIEKETGKTLPLMALLTTQTIRSLSRVILQDGYDRAWSSLVPIQPKGSKPPFFLCHGIGGNVLNYRFLGKYFGEEQPLYGLQSQGLDGKVQPLHRIEDMAAHYIREIQTIQPKGPYFLGGGSFGGVIAFEMAHQLRSQGEQVTFLALLDSIPPWRGDFPGITRSQFLRKRVSFHVKKLFKVPKRTKYVARKLHTLKRRTQTWIWRAAFGSLSRINQPMPKRFQKVKEMNIHALRTYNPQFYSGSVHLFLANEMALKKNLDVPAMWRSLAADVQVIPVPGNHTSLVLEPNVQVLVKELRTFVDENADEAR